MLNRSSKKNGYTLVEVLVVVSIMGVLSSMGVASLRNAVINSRMKDCALNTTAFLERMANEANRMSKRLCVIKDTDQRLTAYVANDCNGSSLSDADTYDTFVIDAPARFIDDCPGIDDFDDLANNNNWATGNDGDGALFIPRIGLSAAPSEGFACMQYGNDEIYGMALKIKKNNMISAMWRSGDYWSRL